MADFSPTYSQDSLSCKLWKSSLNLIKQNRTKQRRDEEKCIDSQNSTLPPLSLSLPLLLSFPLSLSLRHLLCSVSAYWKACMPLMILRRLPIVPSLKKNMTFSNSFNRSHETSLNSYVWLGLGLMFIIGSQSLGPGDPVLWLPTRRSHALLQSQG